ncbi:MAG: hypothetical protein Q4F49_02370 [Pseudoxanthomonas suwonensis]|nr:hypothetical protein [Pseudoxanthomonas suwonensis]
MTPVIKHQPYWELGLPSHLPFRNATEVMVAWEVFETTEHRLRLLDLEQRVFDDLVSEEHAQQEFKAMLGEISRKSAAYTRSIETSSRRLGKKMPTGPTAIRTFASGLAINDRVVCHAAMMQAYGWLMSAWAMAMGEDPAPTYRRQRMGMMVRERALALYDELLSFKRSALDAAGIPPDEHDRYFCQTFEVGGHLPGWHDMSSPHDQGAGQVVHRSH